MPIWHSCFMFSSGSSLHLVVGLQESDLVDEEANAALGDDVRNAVADLDGHNRLGTANAEHGEQVHNGVGAPADHGDELAELDHALHLWVILTRGCISQAHQQG